MAERLQLGKAWDSLRNLVADPDDTAQVFSLIEALGDGALRRVTRRFAGTPTGGRLLQERPHLASLLADWDALAAMPQGSLGREYLAFCQREGIRAEGLEQAADQGSHRELSRSADEEFVGTRLRDMHDLWHVVGGYHADLVGEAGVLAMTVPQTGNPGIAVIVLTALVLESPIPGARRLILRSLQRGRSCAWLPAQDWEALLPQPLDSVRQQLEVGEPIAYMPLYKRDLRGLFRGRPTEGE